MLKTLAIIFASCILVCVGLCLLPVLIVLAGAALLFSGLFAGVELVFFIVAAVAVAIAAVVLFHVFVPLLVPVLIVCAIVYIYKQVRAPRRATSFQ